MGFSDFFKNRLSNVEQHLESEDSLGKVTSQKVEKFLGILSGEGHSYSKRMIDNVVVFMPAAGGCGASTICANTAYMAATHGNKVLVIDLNIMYPSQHIFFGIEQKIQSNDLVSYLLGKNEVGKSIQKVELSLLDGENRIMLLYPNNRGLTDAINCESDNSVQSFVNAIDNLRIMYDLILIDCPRHVENTLINQVLFMCDQIYLVWDEGIGSISNTEKIRRNMGITGIDAYSKMRVILNKRSGIRYSKYPFEKLSIDLVEIFPYCSELIECSLRSELFCQKGASRDKAANDFHYKIGKLAEEVAAKAGRVGIGG
jgi:Mrp family chromosome partitioning ATPase